MVNIEVTIPSSISSLYQSEIQEKLSNHLKKNVSVSSVGITTSLDFDPIIGLSIAGAIAGIASLAIQLVDRSRELTATQIEETIDILAREVDPHYQKNISQIDYSDKGNDTKLNFVVTLHFHDEIQEVFVNVGENEVDISFT